MTNSALATPQPAPAGLPGTVERARVRLLEAVLEPVLEPRSPLPWPPTHSPASLLGEPSGNDRPEAQSGSG